ncbi:hypothetical protein RUM43_012419 [Polyplax serrata]|uniref:Uncharacterized protein n=1 Tax=Polyplax serrata TaxID=468196 RepID=A0AAN8S0C5_POLSC
MQLTELHTRRWFSSEFIRTSKIKVHSEGSEEPESSDAHAQRPNNYLLLVAESDVKQMEAVKMGHEPQECHEMIFWPKGGAGREDPRRI